jgi:hypothetical protein
MSCFCMKVSSGWVVCVTSWILHIKVRGKVVPAGRVVEQHAMKISSIDSCSLNFSTDHMWVVDFISELLYFWGKSPQYPLNMRLIGPQSSPRCCGKEKNLPLLGIELQSCTYQTQGLVTVLLYQVSHHIYFDCLCTVFCMSSLTWYFQLVLSPNRLFVSCFHFWCIHSNSVALENPAVLGWHCFSGLVGVSWHFKGTWSVPSSWRVEGIQA